MADVLLVHVPEDHALVEGLTDTLTRSGLMVTHDPAHEAEAACVLVLWSPASVRSGPVRDLAIHAQREARLVTAKTAGCEAPLGFSKPAPHDLSTWAGDPNDAGLDPMFFAVDRLVCAARLAQQKISSVPTPAPLTRASALAFAGAGAPAAAPLQAPAPEPTQAPEIAAPVIARAPERPVVIEPPAPVAPVAPEAPHRPEPTRSPPPVVAWIAKPRPAPSIEDIPPGPIFRDQKPAPAPVAPPKPATPAPAPVATPAAPAMAAEAIDDDDDDWVEPTYEEMAPLPPAKPLPFGLDRLAWRPITIVGLIVLCGLTIYKLLPPPLLQSQTVATAEPPPAEENPADYFAQYQLPPEDLGPPTAEAPAAPAVAPAPAPPRPEPRRPLPQQTAVVTPPPAIAFQPPPLAPTTVVTPPPATAPSTPPAAASVTPRVASATPSTNPAPGEIVWVRRANARDMADNYPPAAQDRNIAGSALLDCLVLPTRTLSCAVISESPSNQGFGRAAARIASKFQTAPTTTDGGDAIGKRVRLPVRFLPPIRD